MSDDSDGSVPTDPTVQHRFPATWDGDVKTFLPQHIPLRKPARAWDRTLQSPLTVSHGARKVWRRVRMPGYNTSARNEASLPTFTKADHSAHRVTTQSPKKAVKKLCLKTPFGQDWRTTEWESARGGHNRKTPMRPPIVLRSGTVLDPDFDPDKPAEAQSQSTVHAESASNEHDETQTQVLDGDDDWEDIESENEDEIGVTEEAALQACDGCALDEVSPKRSVESDHATIVRPAAAPSFVMDDHSSMPDVVQEESRAIHNAQQVTPDSRSELGASVPIDEHRQMATPPPETETETATIASGTRHKPRMSADDAAFLTAFLSRQASTKKPSIAKRESLTNRRESDTVRQALASPARPDVLAELDANSPSPHKAARHQQCEQAQTEGEREGSPTKHETEAESDAKPTRRSGRSRVRPDLLLNQMTNETKAPSKITIRSSNEPPSLKKSDAQGFTALARANMRKNKAGAIMPPARLSKLAAEMHVDEQGTEQSVRQASSSCKRGKNVRWDETLVYYSNGGEGSAVEAAGLDKVAHGEPGPPELPSNARSKPSSPKKAASIFGAAASAPQVADPAPIASITAPAPSRRRSRIATPAKGLLSRASLLPDGLDADKAQQTTEPSKRSAPAMTAKTSLCSPAKSLSVPASASTVSSSASSGIPSLTAFAPRLSLAVNGTSFEDAVAGTNAGTKMRRAASSRLSTAGATFKAGDEGGDLLPGLNSPAKKRRRGGGAVGLASSGVAGGASGAGRSRSKDDEVVPGLASPAKRRTRNVL